MIKYISSSCLKVAVIEILVAELCFGVSDNTVFGHYLGEAKPVNSERSKPSHKEAVEPLLQELMKLLGSVRVGGVDSESSAAPVQQESAWPAVPSLPSGFESVGLIEAQQA
ncbi:hypothetical protein AOLI_G00293130 [Acnodon oligacanthus]